jgi:hypothetical protein
VNEENQSAREKLAAAQDPGERSKKRAESISSQPQYNSPNMIVLGNSISLSRFIGGVATTIPQYISLSTHMKGGSNRSVRENITEK